MKRLNNKGITTIEVLLCFALVVIITVSMYGTVSSFNQKRVIEEYKQEISTYKNLLTKDMQDDFIKIGLTHATYTKGKKSSDNTITTYTLDCVLKDGTKRRLYIEQRLGYSSYHLAGYKDKDDLFKIQYGNPTESDGMTEYPLPDLGSSTIPRDTSKGISEHKVKDLSINNVIIEINPDTNVLSIQIGFYHPELLTRYGIYIVCPVDYVSSGSDGTNVFPF